MNIKVPVSWLREYLKTPINTKTLAHSLSLAGPSVEGITKLGGDYIFDVEVTSNRPDACSVYGLARETHAILTGAGEKSQLIAPKGLKLDLHPEKSNFLTLAVVIKNHSLCPRFAAIILDNIQVKPAPAVVKNRLEKAGVRAINNIVDIANYLMLELGQPMHTFDYDKIRNHQMILRESRQGEKITTLDGQIRKLPPGTIVIEDEGRLIDLCGIMGGKNSQITKRTKRVLLFVQSYNPQKIRKTTQALSFRTEAATRFEKGIDLAGIIPALSRAVYLAKRIANAKIASELIDIYHAPIPPKPITLNLGKLYENLGKEIPATTAGQLLELLGFEAKVTADTISAIPPSWRVADVESDVDLIEEIARIYGYHNLPSKLPTGPIPITSESELNQVIELKKALQFLGLTEVISYSIISQEFLKLTKVDQKEVIELANPLTSEWQFMRPTILVSLAGIIGQNQNLRNDLKIFEIAKTYLKQEGDLPKQDLTLAVTLQNSDFYQIKGLIENVFEALARQATFQKLTEDLALFEKSQSAQIKVGEKVTGTLGLLNHSILDYFAIENPVAAAEINLTVCYQQPAITKTYQPIPRYPPIIEDISAIFEQEIPIAQIISAVTKTSPLIAKVEIIDIFKGKKIGKGKKSITLRLTYQRSDRTPTQEEMAAVREKIIDYLAKTLAAIIRR